MLEMGFATYYARFGRRLWRDAAPWARDNIFWGIALLVIPPVAGLILHRTSSVDWDFIRLTLYLYGITFLVYLLGHVIRTPWKLDRDGQREIMTAQTALLSCERKIYEGRPQLTLSVIDRAIQKLNGPNLVFFLQNTGDRAARFIDFEPIRSLSGKYRLELQLHPREVLAPGSRPAVTFSTYDDGPVGAVAELMATDVEMLKAFFRDNDVGATATYPIKIRYRDTDNSERCDEMFLQCEWPSGRLSVKPTS
jgi:hypothetical protein